ncbi:MAG: hypothetical protein K9N23_15810 [Akkermansiaceae bacterium]|nr:hypothetical protein [Akkermansiaceae bacterium]
MCVSLTAVSEGFQIQEIVAQDELGIQFRAIDTSSGTQVGLRRFFPFGRDGGGLETHEREEYQRGVVEMCALKHPALQTVLGGGCDPVDGTPYLVTEWVDGESLSALLKHGEFEPDAVVDVMDRALQLCEAISGRLGMEAMWLDTTPRMVVLDQENVERGFTFGISPVRWLVDNRERRSMLPLVWLAETMMGWQGRLLGDHVGRGLGTWIKWLRANALAATLSDARRMLANMTAPQPAASDFTASQAPETSIGSYSEYASSTAPTGPMTREPQATLPAAKSIPDRHLKRLLIWVAILAMLVGLTAWWVVTHPRTARNPTGSAPQLTGEAKRLAEVNALAAALAERSNAADAIVFKAEETQELLNEKDHTITVEGVVKRVRPSNSGATLYLEFGGDEQPEMVRGRVVVKNAGKELSEAALNKWVSKRVRITGRLKVVKLKDRSRPEIVLEDGGSIKEVP